MSVAEHSASGSSELRRARSEALPWLRILDMGVGMPPALISKLLAEFGAHVTAVPPAGDPTAEVYAAARSWRAKQDSKPPGAVSRRELDELLVQSDLCIVGGEE